MGGRRAGAGRPKGARDSRPRISRADILERRRKDWDRWAESSGALRRARQVLLEIVEDPRVKAADRIRAAQLLEERGLGLPTAEREVAPPQPLHIMIHEGAGYRAFAALPEGSVVEGEVVARAE